MMRKLFGRTPATESPPLAARAEVDAHGCPACPHSPKSLHDFEDDGPSTLLPVNQTDIEGHAFDPMAMATEGTANFDDDIADFDLD